MINIKNLVRQNIQNLTAYSSARDEYKGSDGIFLDANENPFGEENRYPDPYQRVLKQKISAFKSVKTENIFLSNGSDEVIDLLFRIFCNPGQDKALTFSPTYGMYDVSADINDVELIKVPLNSEFDINFSQTEPYLKDDKLKLIFVCSPNNPTGNTFSQSAIENLLNSFNGIVVIDEAYIDFSQNESWLNQLDKYNNLVIIQTFSKAWGLANSRVGMAFCNTKIISYLNKVKPPYNISGANQNSAIQCLENKAFYEVNLLTIKCQKIEVQKALEKIPFVEKIYPSDANFLLVKVKDATKIYNTLVDLRVIIRNRDAVIKNCIRITIGTKKENEKLIKSLKKIKL